MAGKGRFHIPSAKEMENITDTQIQVQSLFNAHRSSKTSPQKPPPESSNKANLCATLQQGGKSCDNITREKTQTGNSDVSAGRIVSAEKGTTAPASVPTGAQTETATTEQGTLTRNVMSNEGVSAGGKPGKSNSLIVSTRQRGNPILKHVRNVPWEFGDIVPDYVMGQVTCALFLSLRYHALNPNYVHERLKQLGHSFDLRVLLVQVDTKAPMFALKQLAKVCILSDCTLILAWTSEEAGRYLETYKSFEVKPPDLIMEKTDSDYMSQLTDTLTSVKKVNKTDAMTLLTAFGSLQKIVQASEEDLSLCPGFGPQKARRLHSVFHEPFLKTKRIRGDTPAEKGTASPSKSKVDASPMKEKLAASPRKRKVDLS